MIKLYYILWENGFCVEYFFFLLENLVCLEKRYMYVYVYVVSKFLF